MDQKKIEALFSDAAFNTLLKVYDEWSVLKDRDDLSLEETQRAYGLQSYLIMMAGIVFEIGREQAIQEIIKQKHLRQNYARFKRFYREKLSAFIPPEV